MRKIMFQMSCMLMFVFVVISCSNDNEGLGEIQESPYFTTSDISNLQLFKEHVEKSKKNMRPTATNAIRRNRAQVNGLDELTEDEIVSIRGHLSEVGEEAILLFESLGISKNDLDEACPLDQTELYGMIALEIVDALNPNDVLIAGPDCQIKVDTNKAVQCLLKTVGVDLWPIIDNTILAGFVGYMNKDALKKIALQALKSIASKAGLASLGAVGFGLMVAEWACCYWDVPYLSLAPVTNINSLFSTDKIKNNILLQS